MRSAENGSAGRGGDGAAVRLFAALAGAVALLATPAVASASTASVSGGALNVSDSAGETNMVTIQHDFVSGERVFVEDRAGITPGPGCTAQTATEIECDGAYTAVNVVLGNGNDTLDVGFVYGLVSVNGGAGNDTIGGLYDQAAVDGGDGDDTIDGGNGNDTLNGGPGRDTIEGKGGNDEVIGGPGLDSLVGDSSRTATEGNDTIYARDGERDQVTCGLGADVVTGDQIDVVEPSNCEQVDLGSSGGPTGPGGGDDCDSAKQKLKKAKAQLKTAKQKLKKAKKSDAPQKKIKKASKKVSKQSGKVKKAAGAKKAECS